MRGKHYRYLLIIPMMMLLGFGNLHAQLRDNEQWLGVKVSQNYKDFRWSFEENVRLRYGLSILDNVFSEIGGRYSFNKHVATAFKYRLGYRDFGEDLQMYNRISFDLRFYYKWKDAKLMFRYRPRVQLKFLKDEGTERIWYFRNKLTVSRKLSKKVDLWTGYEIFNPLNHEERLALVDEHRFYLGADIDVGKRKELSIYYLYSTESNQFEPLRAHIVGINYNFKLKKLKKKKKKKD